MAFVRSWAFELKCAVSRIDADEGFNYFVLVEDSAKLRESFNSPKLDFILQSKHKSPLAFD